jgi:hypothetical protein
MLNEATQINISGSQNSISLEYATDKSRYDNELDISRFVDIACSAFKTNMDFEDVKHHTIGSENLYLMRLNDEIVGFGTTRKLNSPIGKILYLDGVAVKEEYQQAGLFKKFLEQVRNGEDFVAGRTQNPVIIGTCKKQIPGAFYPNGVLPPERVKLVGEFIAKAVLNMDDYNRENFVGKGTYGRSLYSEIPKYENTDYIFKNIDFAKGDSLIFVVDCKNKIQ